MDFITTGTIFFVFLFICVLIYAGITDIKTTYLAPATIYLSLGIAVLYVVLMTVTQGTTVLCNSLFSVGLLAVGYFIICLLEKHKRKKNQQRLKEDEWVPEKATEGKKHPVIASILTVAICILYGIFVSDSNDLIQSCVIVSVCCISGIATIIAVKKCSRKTMPYIICGIISLMLTFCFVYRYKTFLPLAGAVAVFAGLLYLFRKQYKDTEITVDSDGYIIEDEEDQEISESLIFGGGDAFVFGAIALMFGLGGFIGIFINAGLFFIATNFVRALFTGRSMHEPAPFIPAITVGLFAYATGFNIFNIAEIWQLLIN